MRTSKLLKYFSRRIPSKFPSVPDLIFHPGFYPVPKLNRIKYCNCFEYVLLFSTEKLYLKSPYNLVWYRQYWKQSVFQRNTYFRRNTPKSDHFSPWVKIGHRHKIPRVMWFYQLFISFNVDLFPSLQILSIKNKLN